MARADPLSTYHPKIVIPTAVSAVLRYKSRQWWLIVWENFAFTTDKQTFYFIFFFFLDYTLQELKTIESDTFASFRHGLIGREIYYCCS